MIKRERREIAKKERKDEEKNRKVNKYTKKSVFLIFGHKIVKTYKCNTF